MYSIIKYSEGNAGIRQYAVDTLKELNTLPGNMGSTAICFETMKFYIKDGQGTWREL